MWIYLKNWFLAVSAYLKILNSVLVTLSILSVISVYSHEIQLICQSPRIYLIRNFLTEEECDYIIDKASSQLQRSTVLDSTQEGAIDDRRTSQGMFFPSRPQSAILREIEQRIYQVTQIPVEHGEGLQVLHYDLGGEYQPHYDYFTVSMPGGAETLARGGQRVATFIMYLNTPAKGGETIFPLAKVKVFPKKGNAVLFYNVTPDGMDDPRSFHGGAPVLEGEKWIVTKWLRAGVFY